MILIGWNHYQNIMVIISLQDLRRGVKCQSDAAATHRPSLCGVYSRAAFINTVEFRDYAPPPTLCVLALGTSGEGVYIRYPNISV